MTEDIGAKFRALHVPGKPFILANAWDLGSAKMLEALGAEAVATSSAAHAFTLGRPDMGTVTRNEAMAHAQELVAAVSVPVSGDFENGYGEAPETVAETVRMSAEIGLAGICIEDTDLPGVDPYDRELAIERIRAGASAARALKGDFVFVARADGVMNETYDMEEALWRVRAFDEAGADCLYVPMPPSMDDVKRICAATKKPVNLLAAGKFASISKDKMGEAGVARISLGSSLARVTQQKVSDTAREMFKAGDFSTLGEGMPGSEVDEMLKGNGDS